MRHLGWVICSGWLGGLAALLVLGLGSYVHLGLSSFSSVVVQCLVPYLATCGWRACNLIFCNETCFHLCQKKMQPLVKLKWMFDSIII